MMLIGQLMLVLLVQVMNMGLFRKLMKMRLVLLGQVMKMGSSRQLTKMRLVLLGQVKMRLFRQLVKMRLFRQLVKMRLTLTSTSPPPGGGCWQKRDGL